MKEPKIRQTILPAAPYPRTPTYRQPTIEVPKDAKVVRVAGYTPPKPRPYKVRTQPRVIPSRDKKPKRRELMPNEIERVLLMYETGYTRKEIAYALKCKYKLVEEAIAIAVADGEIRAYRKEDKK